MVGLWVSHAAYATNGQQGRRDSNPRAYGFGEVVRLAQPAVLLLLRASLRASRPRPSGIVIHTSDVTRKRQQINPVKLKYCKNCGREHPESVTRCDACSSREFQDHPVGLEDFEIDDQKP
jgi:hypothetical protein